MRRYSDPIEVRSAPWTRAGESAAGTRAGESARGTRAGESAGGTRAGESEEAAGTAGERPQAFVWRGRLYVVREVLGHWRERRSWWRDALDPQPGQPVGLGVAAGEQHVWRVAASPGRMHGSGVYDLVRDEVPHPGVSDWRLVRVAD